MGKTIGLIFPKDKPKAKKPEDRPKEEGKKQDKE